MRAKKNQSWTCSLGARCSHWLRIVVRRASFWAWKDWIENPHTVTIHYKRRNLGWEMWTEKRIAELQNDSEKYQDVILSVDTKWPNESRHETAMRYIRERELKSDGPCSIA